MSHPFFGRCLLTPRWVRLFPNLQLVCPRYITAARKPTLLSLPKGGDFILRRYGQVVPFKLSDIGEGIKEVIVKEWHVKVGDAVRQFDPVCEVQSDKATVTITSRYDGTVRKLHFQPDDTCNVGQALVDIELDKDDGGDASASSPTSSSASSKPEIVSSPAPNPDKTVVLTIPSVRRMAAEHNIDLSRVPGTGKDGRVLKEDLLNFVSSQQEVASASPVSTRPVTESAPQVQEQAHSTKADRTVPLSIIQKVMWSTMTASNAIPHFVLSDELDLSNLVELRKDTSDLVTKRYGIKLTYLPFLVKVTSIALKEYPILNASVDPDSKHIIYKAAHNIGLAMDTPQGLLVPNVKNVDQLTVVEIARELARLQLAGSSGKLSVSDLSGGSMTLSNIGSICGTYTAPRILPPEVLIGGIGRIQRLPRFRPNTDTVYGAHIMNVSWAADHRIIDGATVARFSQVWKTLLENPASLLLELK